MMTIRAGVKVHIALGVTDMRKGLDGLAMLVQEVLKQDPFTGLRSCSGTERVCACSRSGWRTVTSRGPAPTNRETPWR